ncbi:Structural maintenance of chromosomes protein 4, partial [Stegodyphus mimosarum]
MTGGGNRVVKGRMGQTVIENSFSSEDVEKMNAALNNLYTKLSDLKQLHRNLEDQISQKSKHLSSVQHSIKKKKLHCTAHKENIEMMKTQIAELKQKIQESAVDKQKVQMLEKKIEEKKKKYEIASEEASVVEEKVSKLQAEILKTSKGKYNKAQKTVDLLTKKISDVSQAITKSSVNMKTSKRNIKKVEEKISNIEKEIVVKKEQVKAIVNERKMITSVGVEIVAKRDEAMAGILECKEKRANLKTKVEQLAEEEHQLKSTEIEYKNKLKNHEVTESEKRAIIKNISAKLQKLKLNEIEEEQAEFPELTREDAAKLSVKTLTSDIELVKLQMESMTPNLSAINEYKVKEKFFNEKQKEVDEITQEKNLQKMRSDELSKRRLSEFMTGFTAIAKKLREIYQMLTFGGGAELELIDPFEPFEKGILFSVKPRGKSWKIMKNLSGGEKTLSSLSLVFALHYYKPTPFYVMDEIDAALDKRNVRIVSYFLKERTKNTQFIIVSLRDTMNELADHLVGIYKINN